MEIGGLTQCSPPASPRTGRAVASRDPKSPSHPLNLFNGVLVAGSVMALIAVTGYAGAVLEAPPPAPAGSGEFVYVPDSRFLRIVSLGHTAAVADVLWFRTIGYFGGHYRSDRLYPWLTKMCDVVTDLDPKAFYVYRFAGVILPWEANQPDDGIALLEKGLKHLPDSWYLHWLQGFNYYFFKGDLANAAFHLRHAAELPGTHPYVSRLAAIIYAEALDEHAAEAFLSDLANSAQDEAMRRVIRDRLGELRLARDIDALADAVRRYQEQIGNLPPRLETLVTAGIMAEIPREPFGGAYLLDPASGQVRTTSGRVALRLYVSKAREEYRKGNPIYR